MAAAAARAPKARDTAAHAQPEQRSPRRPRLDVVERSNRVRRFRPIVALTVLLFAAAALGALTMQISMINRQQQLDAIRTEINDVQESNKALRQRESLLQAPSEILRIAETELGMVKAREAEMVVPATIVIGAASDDVQASAQGGE